MKNANNFDALNYFPLSQKIVSDQDVIMNKKNEQIENLKHSKLGISSFVIAIIFGLVFWLVSMPICICDFGLTKSEQSMILGIMVIVVFVMYIVGIILAVIGLRKTGYIKSYSKSGLKLNIMFLCLLVFITLLGIFSNQIRGLF